MKKMSTLTAAALVVVLVVSGCSQKYSAERDGKKLGQAMCELRDATTSEEAEAALSEIGDQLDDLGNKHALFTAEDRADVQNNLADLHEHAIQGNTALLQQDLAVLRRSVGNIAEDSSEVSRAAWDGVAQGLADCTE